MFEESATGPSDDGSYDERELSVKARVRLAAIEILEAVKGDVDKALPVFDTTVTVFEPYRLEVYRNYMEQIRFERTKEKISGGTVAGEGGGQSGSGAQNRNATAREPSNEQRAIAAKSKKETSTSILESMTVRGRPWANVAVGELDSIRQESALNAEIAEAIKAKVPEGTSTLRPVREFVTPLEFHRIVAAAKRRVGYND